MYVKLISHSTFDSLTQNKPYVYENTSDLTTFIFSALYYYMYVQQLLHQ